MYCWTKPMIGLLLLATALGVPVLEQQFYATVRGATYHDGVLYRSYGSDMYYDTPNQRYRETVGNVSRIADYKNNVGFQITHGGGGGSFKGSCKLMALPHPPAAQIVAPNAVDEGPTSVSGGQPVELWRAIIQGQTVDVAVQTKPDAGRSPVRLLTNASYMEPSCACKPTPCAEKPCFLSEVNDYSNGLHVGPMPDSLFAKPADCKPGNGLLAFDF
jgi:hypothetical protein